MLLITQVITKQTAMKYLLIFCLFATFSKVCFSQQINKFERPTDKHLNIPGTNIYMIPPGEFQISENFKGFQNPNDQLSMIMVMEFPGPFSEVSKGFHEKMLQSKGMILKSKKKIDVNQYNGYLINLEQEANGLLFDKYIILYGDEKLTIMINGMYIKDSIQLGKKVEASILSTVVNSSLKIDPRNSLDYSIDETVGNLEFKNVMGNGMVFKREYEESESDIEVTLITDKSFAKMQIENKKLFCISRLKKYPDDYSIIVQKGINEIEIDGLKGFQLFAKNNDKIGEQMYQVILFEEVGGYFLFTGIYKGEKEKAEEDLKLIVKTFRRK